jgi:uncharacterized protein (DUF488 family)
MDKKEMQKPVFKRQQFLVAFIHAIDGGCTATELQKLTFLYSYKNQIDYYDFVPYKYGSYSFQLADDVKTLQAMGWIKHDENRIRYTGFSATSLFDYSLSDFSSIEKLRGNRLVKEVYLKHPYYAINSEIASKLLNDTEIKIIQDARDKIESTDRVLFTIGYEGLSVESYLNILIKNNIRLLCDVRNNPLSRKFGFSKSSLSHFLSNVGIEYVHIPELGIISDKRKTLETKEDYEALFAAYEKTLPKKTVPLETLYTLFEKNNRIALTCFEHDSEYCHRHVIRDYLVKNYHVKAQDL